MSVKQINSKEFENEVLSAKGKVIVDFFANWCGPCKMLAPIMEDISKDYNVVKVDIDENEELAEKFSVMSIPCVIMFENGKEISRSVGFLPKDGILSELGEK